MFSAKSAINANKSFVLHLMNDKDKMMIHKNKYNKLMRDKQR